MEAVLYEALADAYQEACEARLEQLREKLERDESRPVPELTEVLKASEKLQKLLRQYFPSQCREAKLAIIALEETNEIIREHLALRE